MSQEIEIEFKNLLTPDEFFSLQKAFDIKEAEFVIQHNDYFDTPGFDLKAKGSALRIREKRDQYILTLKQPGEIGLIETHQPLTHEEAVKVMSGMEPPHGEVIFALDKLGISPGALRHLGRLTTKRAEFPYQDGLLVLDHSFYGDSEDYELEYEVKDPDLGRQIYMKFLKQYGIPERLTENKIRRLMNNLNK